MAKTKWVFALFAEIKQDYKYGRRYAATDKVVRLIENGKDSVTN